MKPTSTPAVNQQTAMRIFSQADALFRAGRFPEALRLLDELDSTYPKTPNIMYPRALCLERLGQYAEAVAVCDRLISHFNDPRAHVLKARLITTPTSPLAAAFNQGLDAPDFTYVDDPVPPKPPSSVPSKGSASMDTPARIAWAGFALLAAGIVALVLLPWFGPPVLWRLLSAGPTFAGVFALSFSLNYIFCGLCSHALLHAFHKLPGDSLVDDVAEVARISFFIDLLMFVPVIGWIAVPYLLARRYELEALEVLPFAIAYIVVAISILLSLSRALGMGGIAWLAWSLL